MVLLLCDVGYYDERPFAFPQFYIDLRFVTRTSKQAIPDITVINVLSFIFLIMLEDKKSNVMRYLNSDSRVHCHPPQKKLRLKRRKCRRSRKSRDQTRSHKSIE